MQYRQVGALAAALGFAQQQARVDFAVVGQVQGNVPGAAEQRVLCQLAVQANGGLALLGRGEGAAGIAEQATELGAGELRGVGHGTGDRCWPTWSAKTNCPPQGRAREFRLPDKTAIGVALEPESSRWRLQGALRLSVGRTCTPAPACNPVVVRIGSGT